VKAGKVRVCAVQYFIRPIELFEQFEEQTAALLETAADYKSQLVVFPEYFTTQLLTLGNVRRPIAEQIHELADKGPRFISMMSELAKRHSMYIAAGSIPVLHGQPGIRNRCFLFSPTGEFTGQDKLHMTRFEAEEWNVSGGDHLCLFETDLGKLAITLCYDVEFPELARVAARMGAHILLVPSCTDDRHGFLRVRYCAHARAIENQMYVVHASTVGSLPMVPAVSLNYGLASILTPNDYPFARDGILAEGVINQEMMVVGDLDVEKLEESRKKGTVLPLRDSERSAVVADKLEVIQL
jgi:predicted amidohydrolase